MKKFISILIYLTTLLILYLDRHNYLSLDKNLRVLTMSVSLIAFIGIIKYLYTDIEEKYKKLLPP